MSVVLVKLYFRSTKKCRKKNNKNFVTRPSNDYMDWRWPSWISKQHIQCSMLDLLIKQKTNIMVRTTSVAFLSSLAPMGPVVKEN